MAKHGRQTDVGAQTLDPVAHGPNVPFIEQDGLADGGDDGGDAVCSGAFCSDDGVGFGLGGGGEVREGGGSGG